MLQSEPAEKISMSNFFIAPMRHHQMPHQKKKTLSQHFDPKHGFRGPWEPVHFLPFPDPPPRGG